MEERKLLSFVINFQPLASAFQLNIYFDYAQQAIKFTF